MAALTSALLEGHICLELNDLQQQLVARSTLAAKNSRAPLVLSGRRLYFGRYFSYEAELSEVLVNLAGSQVSFSQHEDPEQGDAALEIDDPYQQRAVTLALTKQFCIISGGPGTGKPTLIVSILLRLLHHHGPDLRIALAAPTGKAAHRFLLACPIQNSRWPVVDPMDQDPTAA